MLHVTLTEPEPYKLFLQILAMTFLWTSFGHVAVGAAVPGLAVCSGLFSRAPGIHTGLAHYAESVAQTWPEGITHFMPMPANTLVNLGYVGIGAYWLHRTYQNVHTGLYSRRQVSRANSILQFDLTEVPWSVF